MDADRTSLEFQVSRKSFIFKRCYRIRVANYVILFYVEKLGKTPTLEKYSNDFGYNCVKLLFFGIIDNSKKRNCLNNFNGNNSKAYTW